MRAPHTHVIFFTNLPDLTYLYTVLFLVVSPTQKYGSKNRYWAQIKTQKKSMQNLH